MATKIIEFKKPKLKKPIFIEGLPGVGNVGRIAAGYLIEELKAVKFAELISSHFMPFVMIPQGSTVHMLKNEFYYWKAKNKKQRDLIILIGDSQSTTPEGHYEIVEEILKYIKKLGVKEIITLAGLSIGMPVDKPKVIGAVNKEGLEKKYEKYGILFDSSKRIGTIVGAAGLFLGLSVYHKMDALCLLGETSGMPLIPDPKSSEAILKVLSKILNLRIDTSRLQAKVKEMKDFMKKVEDMQKKMYQQMAMPKGRISSKDKLTYIG